MTETFERVAYNLDVVNEVMKSDWQRITQEYLDDKEEVGSTDYF